MKGKEITITFSEWFYNAFPLADTLLVDDTKNHSTDKTKKKYELTSEATQVNGHILYRIKALRDFEGVKAGALGGFIETENNLSQNDNCWIYGDAKVYGNSEVYGNAKVYNKSQVFDNAKVFGNAKIFNNVSVYDNAKVYGDAVVFDDVRVYEDAQVFGNANVRDRALIGDKALVYGNTYIFGYATILGNAVINANSDYIVFKNWWSSGRYFTWTRSNNMWKVGCFYGTGQELVDKAYEDSEESGREYQRIVNYVQDILGLPHIEPNHNN